MVPDLSGMLRELGELPSASVSMDGGPVKKALRASAKLIRSGMQRRILAIVLAPRKRNRAPSLLLMRSIGIRSRAMRGGANGEAFYVGSKDKKYPVTNPPSILQFSRRRGAPIRTMQMVTNTGRRSNYPTTRQIGRILEYGTKKIKAHMWMRNTFRQDGPKAVDLFRTQLRKELDKVYARLRKHAHKNMRIFLRP